MPAAVRVVDGHGHAVARIPRVTRLPRSEGERGDLRGGGSDPPPHVVEVAFEHNLAALGVELICSQPYHPETLGKLERFHRTLKTWLTDEGPAYGIEHLQELIDGFRHHYNRERPHQAIDNRTPYERFHPVRIATDSSPALGVDAQGEPVYPPHSLIRKVTSVGNVGYECKLITVGRRWAGARVRIVPVGRLINIYYGEECIRTLALDPERYNQPLGVRKKRNKPVR